MGDGDAAGSCWAWVMQNMRLQLRIKAVSRLNWRGLWAGVCRMSGLRFEKDEKGELGVPASACGDVLPIWSQGPMLESIEPNKVWL